MNARELAARLGENAEEVYRKALQCETVEELVGLAEDNEIELSEQEAGELLSLLHPRVGELSDSELDAVTGGSDEKDDWSCPYCGGTEIWPIEAGMKLCMTCRKGFI